VPHRLKGIIRHATQGITNIYHQIIGVIQMHINPKCGSKMTVVAVINEHKIIERILSHEEKTGRFDRAMPTYREILHQHQRSPDLLV
jgi:hypothetical protein